MRALGPTEKVVIGSALIVGLVGVLAALGNLSGQSGSIAAASPTARPTGRPTARPTLASTPTVAASPSAVVIGPVPVTPAPTPADTEVTVDDPSGDLLDGNDVPVDGPAYVDITRLTISHDADSVGFQMVVGAHLPTVSSELESLSYVVVLETTGDDDMDFWLQYDNRASGEWVPALIDWTAGGQTKEGAAFIGALSHVEDLVFGRVGLDQLGGMVPVKACVITQASGPDFEVAAEDNVPAGSCLGGAWITVPR